MSSRSKRPLPLLAAGLWIGALVALFTLLPIQARAQSASDAPASMGEVIRIPSPAITDDASPFVQQPTTLLSNEAPDPPPSWGVVAGALLLIGLVVAGVALTVSALLADRRRRKRGYKRRGRRYGAPPSSGVDSTSSGEDGVQRTRIEPVHPRG